VSLKDSLEKEFGVKVPIRAGAPGSLNLFLNGEKIFSRQQQNQPPSPAAIIQQVRAKSINP
jgi:predicted Rdx family selenoprotein